MTLMQYHNRRPGGLTEHSGQHAGTARGKRADHFQDGDHDAFPFDFPYLEKRYAHIRTRRDDFRRTNSIAIDARNLIDFYYPHDASPYRGVTPRRKTGGYLASVRNRTSRFLPGGYCGQVARFYLTVRFGTNHSTTKHFVFDHCKERPATANFPSASAEAGASQKDRLRCCRGLAKAKSSFSRSRRSIRANFISAQAESRGGVDRALTDHRVHLMGDTQPKLEGRDLCERPAEIGAAGITGWGAWKKTPDTLAGCDAGRRQRRQVKGSIIVLASAGVAPGPREIIPSSAAAQQGAVIGVAIPEAERIATRLKDANTRLVSISDGLAELTSKITETIQEGSGDLDQIENRLEIVGAQLRAIQSLF